MDHKLSIQRGAAHDFYVFNVDKLIASAGADYVVPEILPGIECANAVLR